MSHRQESAVHELDQGVQLVVVDVVEEEHRMWMQRCGHQLLLMLLLLLLRSVMLLQQQRLEEGRTGAEDQFVGADSSVAGRQGHVQEQLLLPGLAICKLIISFLVDFN